MISPSAQVEELQFLSLYIALTFIRQHQTIRKHILLYRYEYGILCLLFILMTSEDSL